jgi:hypothetical protein
VEPTVESIGFILTKRWKTLVGTGGKSKGLVMNKETFCSLPFTEIFLGPDTEIKTCCSSRQGLGKLKNFSITSA